MDCTKRMFLPMKLLLSIHKVKYYSEYYNIVSNLFYLKVALIWKDT